MPKDLTPTKSDSRGAAPPQGRISTKLRKALVLLEREYMSQNQAATLAGLDPAHLSRALRKQHVAAERQKLKDQQHQQVVSLKASAKDQAILVGLDLMHNAKSENVRARMVEFFAGEDRKGQQIQVNTAVHVGGQGYEFAPHGAEIVEIQAAPDGASPADDEQEPGNQG